MAGYLDVLFFSLIGGVFSLVAGVLLLRSERTAKGLARYATPFAAGALLAAAFFDLLPESIELTAEGAAVRWMLGGLLLFFLLEHFLKWFHHHHHEDAGHEHGNTASLIIIGDSIHNFLDGIAIGAAFLISVPTGIVAAIAVAAHEIPQEIGDFGLLLRAGYERRKVLLINAMSALMSTAGALLTFWIGNEASLPVGELLAITAGMFVYIAASDLIPAIHQNKEKFSHLGAVLLIAGVLVVAVATEVAHEYIDIGHEHDIVCNEATEAPCDGDHNYPRASEAQELKYMRFYQPETCLKDGVEGIIAYDVFGGALPKDTADPIGCSNLPLCSPLETTVEGDPANTPCFLATDSHNHE